MQGLRTTRRQDFATDRWRHYRLAPGPLGDGFNAQSGSELSAEGHRGHHNVSLRAAGFAEFLPSAGDERILIASAFEVLSWMPVQWVPKRSRREESL